MISTKYAPAVCALLAIVMVPTVLHTYIGARKPDGLKTEAIGTHLADLQGVDTGRAPRWGAEALSTTDSIERRYGRDLTLFVGRSYDAKALYHHPELVVAYGQEYSDSRVVRFAARPDIPVHVLSGGSRTAAYALLYGGRFVEDPIRFQVSNALALLVRPRQLMTLFFVHGPAAVPPVSERTPAVALLLQGIDSFMAQAAHDSPPNPD